MTGSLSSLSDSMRSEFDRLVEKSVFYDEFEDAYGKRGDDPENWWRALPDGNIKLLSQAGKIDGLLVLLIEYCKDSPEASPIKILLSVLNRNLPTAANSARALVLIQRSGHGKAGILRVLTDYFKPFIKGGETPIEGLSSEQLEVRARKPSTGGSKQKPVRESGNKYFKYPKRLTGKWTTLSTGRLVCKPVKLVDQLPVESLNWAGRFNKQGHWGDQVQRLQDFLFGDWRSEEDIDKFISENEVTRVNADWYIEQIGFCKTTANVEMGCPAQHGLFLDLNEGKLKLVFKGPDDPETKEFRGLVGQENSNQEDQSGPSEQSS